MWFICEDGWKANRLLPHQLSLTAVASTTGRAIGQLGLIANRDGLAKLATLPTGGIYAPTHGYYTASGIAALPDDTLTNTRRQRVCLR